MRRRNPALTWGPRVATIGTNVQPRRETRVGRPLIRPFAEESGRIRPPPKEQPPWNLSGTKDRKGDDSLESEARLEGGASTDGVGGSRTFARAAKSLRFP